MQVKYIEGDKLFGNFLQRIQETIYKKKIKLPVYSPSLF